MAAPAQFGPYRLVTLIATGGMAEIHLAKTRGIGGFEKVVALKMIHPNFSSDDHFIHMLIDEAKISVQLQHANIAHTFDLGRVDQTYYIAMEYVDGWDLFRILRRASEVDRPMPAELAAYVTKEVLAGLDYAHRKRDDMGRGLGIIHRDVSPQNVLISRAGEVKLVDFGIAKATMRARQTAAGVIKGKYYYMSPEQAWGDPLDHRTDIFSAGIIAYEMLTGQMLYLEENMERLLDRVRKADIPPVSARRPDVPREIERAVMRALAKKPDLRWQHASDFAAALEAWLHQSAPDFSAQKLAGWVAEVMRDAAPAPPPADALVSPSDFTDENSIIYTLGKPRPAARAPDQATTPSGGAPVTATKPIAPPRPARPRMGTVPPDRVTAAVDPPDETIASGPPAFAPPRETIEIGLADIEEAGAKTRLSMMPVPDEPKDDADEDPTRLDVAGLAGRTRGGPPMPPARRIGRRTPVGLPAQVVAPARLPLAPPQDTVTAVPVAVPRQISEQLWPPAATPTWGTTEADDSLPFKLVGRRPWKKIAVYAVAAGAVATLIALGASLTTRPPPPPERVTLEVISIPPGARLSVDGKDAGVTPVTLDPLRPGTALRLRIELDRHEVWERGETVTATPNGKLIASLKPIVGELHVESVPLGAEVFLNNKSIGVTPLTKSDMDPFVDGVVEVRKVGFKPERRPFAWAGQRRIDIRVELLPGKD